MGRFKLLWGWFLPENGFFRSKLTKKGPKKDKKGPKKIPKNFLQRPKTRSYIFSSCSGIWNSCLCEVFSHLLNCSRNYIFSSLLKYSTFKIFLILTSLEQTLKNTMLNKSGYFRTLPSIKKSTHLDL